MYFLLFSIILALSCIASFLIVERVRRWSLSKNYLDIPNQRSSHQIPTPRGGGIGIFIGTVGALLISYPFSSDIPLSTVAIYCFSTSIVAVTGWLDDRYTLPSLKRLALYSSAALIFIWGVSSINAVQIPVAAVLRLTALEGLILTAIWLIGFVNAFNFMDGIDGIAGAQALIAGSAWCILLLFEGSWTLALLSGLVAATSLGFLLWNAPPARIFMGDVGSTFLGFTLAALPILAFQQTQNPRLFIVGILILASFLFDTTLTLASRALRRENILQPHRSHLYQRLTKAGFSHARVTLLYSGLAVANALAGLLYDVGSETVETIVVIFVVFLHVSLLLGVWSVENKAREPKRY